jgi:hypothetical protein
VRTLVFAGIGSAVIGVLKGSDRVIDALSFLSEKLVMAFLGVASGTG